MFDYMVVLSIFYLMFNPNCRLPLFYFPKQISVFRMGEGDSDEIDITILTALLQGEKHLL